jgi:hypothetical protein
MPEKNLAIADEDDLLVAVNGDDLRSLLSIAFDQVDEIADEETASGYGLSVRDAVRLASVARVILEATA